MRVPEIGLLLSDGERTTLRVLAAEGPVALVFLRHLGCIFCREQVATLRDALPTENVVFVTMAEPKLAARFRAWMRSPHPFLCDPERRLYTAFGLQCADRRTLFGQRVVLRGVGALLKGYRQGRIVGDPWQLGGTFVIDADGCVTASFPAADAGDHPSPEALRNALAAGARASSAMGG